MTIVDSLECLARGSRLGNRDQNWVVLKGTVSLTGDLGKKKNNSHMQGQQEGRNKVRKPDRYN